MEAFSVYKDMQSRTNGEIYIGVVGPVRTGKSTFIKKFMDTTVIPNIEDEAARDRANRGVALHVGVIGPNREAVAARAQDADEVVVSGRAD